MSKAPEKYVIGLTGNIGTGKTVVRRMLEQLGAFTIDADGLSHRAIARGAPGYEPVVRAFGSGILNVDGEINRTKLGAAVFHDPPALEKLEAIIHPLVRQAVGLLIQRARQPVVVIEAIKLLEGNLPQLCDSIWVTYAPPSVQLERLTGNRTMSREQALLRINAQGSQADKITAANVVIRNVGSYDDLWRQVAKAWREDVPVGARSDLYPEREAIAGEVIVTRGRPEDSEMLAGLIKRLDPGSRKSTADEVMARVGQTTYMLVHLDREVVGLASWRVENLVACTGDLHFEPAIDVEKALTKLIREIERVSADLQCDASLLFLTSELATRGSLWKRLGYERGTPESLAMQAWRDAANEFKSREAEVFFKRLPTDPILAPTRTGAVQLADRTAQADDAADS